VFTARSPWGRALLGTLDALSPDSIEELALPGEVVSELVANLLALAVGKPTVHPRPEPKLLSRIRQSLHAQAHDPPVTPLKAAKDHEISRRYLHGLFAATGTTFSKELMRLRLERAHGQLADPRSAHMSISHIAWNCDFNDSSHFARRFHERYGIAPRDYRLSVLSQTQLKCIQD
jgi:AraC-like DNA-binding protein